MSYGTKVQNGTKTLPGYAFENDPDTGIYLVAAGQLGVSVGDTKIAEFTTSGLDITGTLAVNGSTSTFTHSGGPILRLVRDDANDYRFDISTDGTNLKFTPQDSGGFAFAAGGGTGNVSMAGTLDVTGNFSGGGSTNTFTNAGGPTLRLVRDDANDYRFDISTDGTNMVFTPQDSGGFSFVAGGGTGNVTMAGTLSVTGDLNHDGSNVGFYGTAPAAQATGYTTFTNLSTDRTCDADTVAVAELADIVGTLIEDLKSTGIIAA